MPSHYLLVILSHERVERILLLLIVNNRCRLGLTWGLIIDKAVLIVPAAA